VSPPLLRHIPARRPRTARRPLLRAALLGAVIWTAGLGPGAAQETIRIATEGAYPPFNYVENNEPTGFEVELGRALCQAMTVTCLFVLQDWDGMGAGLHGRRYDAIMSSLEITPERRKKAAFSKPYYRIPAALIGPKGSAADKATGAAALVGKTVGTVADSEFAGYLESQQGVEVRTFGKIEEASLDLLTGRIDYVLGDKLALWGFLDSREGKACCRFVADLPVNRGEGIGIAFRKTDSGLRDRFDAAIDRVVADGTYDRIRAKYFAFDIK
jgi:polar amino acid transport system substrate-binding protein